MSFSAPPERFRHSGPWGAPSPARRPGAQVSVLLMVAFLVFSSHHAFALVLTGLNLAGAEFGSEKSIYGQGYIYPSDDDLDFVAKRGLNVIRLPFLWERLQTQPGGELEPAELARLDDAVARARRRKLAIILDVHNYGRYRGERIGDAGAPTEKFADFWKRLAAHFANQEGVIFGLMNEPFGMISEHWVASANAAIAAIRAAGAHNLVLAPGNAWTGAHSWNASSYGAPNSVAMRAIVDPCENTAIEFHQYFDQDFSGTKAACQPPEVGVKALKEATDWLRGQKRKGFLAEFGTGPGVACLATLDAALSHLDQNGDVWLGWTYWAAGAWWTPDYPLSVEPRAGADRPQTRVLVSHRKRQVDSTNSCVSSLSK